MPIYGNHQNKREFTEAGFEHTRTVETRPNTIIAVGGLVGVTTDHTPAGNMFWVAEQGTFELTSTAYDSLSFAKGAVVNITVANEVGTIATAGTVKLGHATEAKPAGAGNSTIKVRLATGVN